MRDAFQRLDESSDLLFYRQARLVLHIDEPAVDAVTQVYREFLPAGGRILDLMSSWVSHLPEEVEYASVTGLGMNQQELDANPRLDARIVHDLNREPTLPLADALFDAATICVSVQYLTQPVVVLRDVARVVASGGPLVITFSNRCFPTKAVAIWQALDDAGHAQLIERYLTEAGTWRDIRALDRSPHPGQTDPLFAVVAYAQ